MNTDPPHDPSGKRAPMTAAETINSMCLQPAGELNNQHERDNSPIGYKSTYHDSPILNSTHITLANRNTIGSMIFPDNWA
eukprot:5364429-Heterocapsa_arctica.AAC.1